MSHFILFMALAGLTMLHLTLRQSMVRQHNQKFADVLDFEASTMRSPSIDDVHEVHNPFNLRIRYESALPRLDFARDGGRHRHPAANICNAIEQIDLDIYVASKETICDFN